MDPIEIRKKCHECLTNPCGRCPYGDKQVRDSEKLAYQDMALLYTPIVSSLKK